LTHNFSPPSSKAIRTPPSSFYYHPKCMMLFGDAKESLNKLFWALKA
jgi:hypothetical protein